MGGNASDASEAALKRAVGLSNRNAGAEAVDGLLREDGPAYAGLTTGQAELLRGKILLALACRELPDAAVQPALDDIASPHAAFAVASAARALRSSRSALGADAADVLLRAVHQMADRDDTVVLPPRPGASDGEATSVMVEILRTLAWLAPAIPAVRSSLVALQQQAPPIGSARTMAELGRTLEALGPTPAASCCRGSPSPPLRLRAVDVPFGEIRVEGQDGRVGRLGTLLGSRPSLLAFFYTRCSRPEKCSLTVTRLARVRQALERDGTADAANVFGMTYDPDYDTADRLQAYGTARGMPFGEGCGLFRTVSAFADVRRALELRVGYGPATVNQHAVEVALLDGLGRVTCILCGLDWNEAHALALLSDMIGAQPPL